MKYEFKNGSSIETIDNISDTIRGKNHWDLSKWAKQHLSDNPHLTEQDIYDHLYGRFGDKKGDNKNELN